MKRIFPFERYHLRSNHLLDGVSKDTLLLFDEAKVSVQFKKRDIIFKENTFPSGLFVVKAGLVKKFTDGYDGNPHIFYICKHGETLGYHAILCEQPYADSSEAMTNCEIEILPKEVFLEAVKNDKALEKNLLQNLSHEFGFFITTAKILSQLSVRQRTAVTLLLLEEKFNDFSETKNKIDIRRDDFSSLVGTSKESLVRVLHDFKEESIIESEGRKITIINREKLLQITLFT